MFKKTWGDRPNQRHAMTMMKIVSCLDSEGLWQPDSKMRIRWRVQRLINMCAAVASASWLETLSRFKPQLASTSPHSEFCTSSDELSQFHLSRDTISTVSPPSYHIELLSHRDARLHHDPNRKRPEGDPPHPTIVLNSTSFSSGAQLALLQLTSQLGIPVREQLATLDWYQQSSPLVVQPKPTTTRELGKRWSGSHSWWQCTARTAPTCHTNSACSWASVART